MRQGRFITLEGGECVGKTTQSTMLAAALQGRGISVLQTREPGGSPGSEQLRAMLLGGTIDWAPKAETLLHFAARAEHVAKTIQPALAAGQWVICDRFSDSTVAYQGYGQGAAQPFIHEQVRLLDMVPDLTLVLDVASATVLEQRRRQRGGESDRYERRDNAFHDRVRQGFRQIALASPDRCILLDASPSAQAVHAAVMAAVWTRLMPDQ